MGSKQLLVNLIKAGCFDDQIKASFPDSNPEKAKLLHALKSRRQYQNHS